MLNVSLKLKTENLLSTPLTQSSDQNPVYPGAILMLSMFSLILNICNWKLILKDNVNKKHAIIQ